MRAVTNRKCAICRSNGKKLYLKGDRCYMEKCAMTKRNYPPGAHGDSFRGRKSEYGRQLKEKQKVKNVYAMAESQFARYVEEASRAKGLVTANLWKLLENRLDNIIFRLGWASSRSHARQMVSHGLVKVNDRKVDIPSYRVRRGDVVAFKDSVYKDKKEILQLMKKNLKDRVLPQWLKFDNKTYKGKVMGEPNVENVEKDLDLMTVVEFYSRR